MNNELIKTIPGATAFRDWYGWFPGFHDANVTLTLNQEGACTITLVGYQMTDRVKPDGFFELEKHYRVVLQLTGVSYASFAGFQPGWAIIHGMTFVRHEDGIWVEIAETYGLSATLIARNITLEFQPTDGM